MKVDAIRAELGRQNPQSRIVENAPDGVHVTELVREDGGTPNKSTALAVIELSPRHYHNRMVEIYRVERGVLTLHVDEETAVLRAGDEFRIEPPSRHWAESDPDDPAWVHVTCIPAFSSDDYILDP